MPDKLIEAIEELEPGSCAPAVVAAICSMPDLTLEGKRAVATIFLAAYKEFIK